MQCNYGMIQSFYFTSFHEWSIISLAEQEGKNGEKEDFLGGGGVLN